MLSEHYQNKFLLFSPVTSYYKTIKEGFTKPAGIILLLIISVRIHAQNPRLIFDQISSENGLTDNSVIDISQDENGFVWIGTLNGLNRYDGWQFEKFYKEDEPNSLPSNRIRKITKLSGNFISIATDRGLATLNTRTNEFRKIQMPSTPGMESFANDIIYTYYTSNKLFVSTRTGIFIFNMQLQLIAKFEANFSTKDAKTKGIGFASRIFQLNDDTTLINTDRGIVFYENKTQAINYLRDSKNIFHARIAKFLDSMNEYSLGSTRKNVLFVASNSSRFIYTIDFNNQSIDSTLWPKQDVNESGWRSFFYYDNDSTFLFNSIKGGFFLMHYSGSNKKIAVASEKKYPDYIITSFFASDDKRIWIATEKNGILKQSFSKELFDNTTLVPSGKNDLPADVKGFYRKNNFLCTGIESEEAGFLIFDGEKELLKKFDLRSYFKNGNDVWNITPWYNDTLAIATQGGLLFYNTTNEKISKPGKNFPASVNMFPVTCVFKDKFENTWIGLGFGQGVLLYDHATKKVTQFSPGESNKSFKLRYPFDITEDTNGNIWFLRSAEGLTRWNYHTGTFDTLINSFKHEDIHDYDFFSMDADGEGNLWLGFLDHGLMKWNLASGERKIYTVKSGMADNSVFAVFAKVPGEVWVIYRTGIGVLNTKTGNTTNFDKTNGLPAYAATSPNFYYDSLQHQLMLGFENAFTAFDPISVASKKPKHKIYFTQIKDQSGSEIIDPDEEVSLKYFQNNLSISFSAIDFDNSIDNNYEYRLYKNENTPWINIFHQQTVNFINLNPGKYNFQVRIIGETNSEISKEISISYPYYQTTWFYIICAMLTVAALYGLYRYRVNQLLHVQKVRNRISADLHDDIGARLTNINLLSALIEQKIYQPEQATEYLQRVENEVQNSSEALDDIVWSINTKNDSAEEITSRMRRYAANVFDGTDIQYAIYADDNVLSVKLPMEKRRDFFLVYKEAINNVYKHAMATEVHINVEARDGNLVMKITDNGKGFDTQKPTHRNGLNNIRYRLEKFKGEFLINSIVGGGTTLIVKLPYYNASLKRSILKWFTRK